LYKVVYQQCDIIGHFSQYSRDRVKDFFPELAPEKHVIHLPFLPTHLLGYKSSRNDARKAIGLLDCEIGILAFGQLRKSTELELLLRGFAYSKTRRKRMVFAARLPAEIGIRRRMQRRARLAIWRRMNPVIWRNGYIVDCQVSLLFQAADAVVIPRAGSHLNSGILPLAMAFGTPIIAPRYGAYNEYLAETNNELYDALDYVDLAKAIDRMAVSDRSIVSSNNRGIAAQWGWDQALSLCLPRILDFQDENRVGTRDGHLRSGTAKPYRWPKSASQRRP
jgi:glycosyltransferase involved in cell wall biosynthesis